MDIEEFVKEYIHASRRVLDKEIEIRRKTRIHEVAVNLNMSVEEVEKIWNGDGEIGYHRRVAAEALGLKINEKQN